jgi:hypothetical protein
MGNILSIRMWTNIRPGSLQPEYQKLLLLIVAVLFIFSIVFNLLKNRKRNLLNKIWQKLANFSVSNFIISVLLLFFTYELVPFLSMRLWFLFWGIEMLVWLFFVVKIFLKIPELKEKIKKEEEFKKYIP